MWKFGALGGGINTFSRFKEHVKLLRAASDLSDPADLADPADLSSLSNLSDLSESVRILPNLSESFRICLINVWLICLNLSESFRVFLINDPLL